jgi:hypothetical protein
MWRGSGMAMPIYVVAGAAPGASIYSAVSRAVTKSHAP